MQSDLDNIPELWICFKSQLHVNVTLTVSQNIFTLAEKSSVRNIPQWIHSDRFSYSSPLMRTLHCNTCYAITLSILAIPGPLAALVSTILLSEGLIWKIRCNMNSFLVSRFTEQNSCLLKLKQEQTKQTWFYFKLLSPFINLYNGNLTEEKRERS